MPDRSSIGVRVRPNANDFIRDLERQLAAKKKTFYVDVKANLKPANKDIAEWARVGIKKIRAVIPVGADMAKATTDLAAWRRRQLANRTNIPVGVNLAKAYAETLAFRKVAGKDIEINLRINTQSADKAAERFEQAMARRGVSIPVHGDVAPARREIDRDLVTRLKSQGGIILPVGADTDSAAREVRTFAASVARTPAEIQVDADTKKVRLELLRLRLDEARRKIVLDVDVKRGALENFERSLSNIGKSFGKLNIIRSLNLGPLTFGKPTGLVGSLATITALAGAVPGAVTALAALAKALIDLSGAAAIVPGALGAVAASIATIAIGTQGVGDAFGAMFDLWKEGSDAQQTQAKSTARAHDQLRNSVVDEAQAQREVASARREATSDLRNLNNELRGSVLNEAQAILDLQKARDTLARGGFDTATDQKQAELDVAKAVENVTTVRERNNQLQQKANDENAKGVEGSDRVTQALENQTRAAQATATAMQAISDSQAAGATSKFNDALSQLSPNAREAVLAVSGMKGELFDFRMLLQDKIFAGVGPALVNTFHGLEPILRSGMGRIAEGLNANILQIFDTLQSPTGQSIIERILGGTADAQAKFSEFLDPFIKGLGTLMAAGAEHLPQLIDLFTRLADRFATFIDTADKSGKLDEFMDRGITALENIVEIGLNAIKIVNDLSNAFEGDLLGTIRDLTERLHNFLASDQGQQQLKDWIIEAKKLWEDWKPVLEELPGLFSRLSDVAKRALDVITPTLTLILEALEKCPGLVELFAAAWIGAKMASAITKVVSLGKTIGTLVTNLTGLPGLLARVPGLPGGPGVLTGPGSTAPLAAGGGGLAAAATAGGALAAVAAPVAALGTLQTHLGKHDYSISPADAAPQIAELNKRLPSGIPAADSNDARLAVEGLGKGPDAKPAGKWVQDANEIVGGGGALEFAKRYTWLMSQPNAMELLDDPNFVPPAVGSYAVGGHTDWPKTVGRAALLHGNEYVEPADVVEHYGVKAMENIHKKRIPKAALAAEKYGFQQGGLFDPNTGQWKLPNPMDSALGPVPGPIPGTLVDTPVGPIGNPQDGPSLNIAGMNFPFGGQQFQDPTRGWGPGGPPPGLGGGSDAFDIRNFGIGPGPPGSGPSDWSSAVQQIGGNFISGLFSAGLEGILGVFGAEGLLSSPAFTAATGLTKHFVESPGVQGTSTQAPGAADTNAAVDSLLNTWQGMPGNPATGVTNLPNVIDPKTGSAINPSGPGNGGLQTNTLKGKAAIQQYFPWATNIGGVRADAKKWHPQGLALDVMIPGAGGLNDPTPPTGLQQGNQLYAWLKAHQTELGIDYILWQEKDHYNHLHVNFAPSGYPSGGGPGPAAGGSTVAPPQAAAPRTPWWQPQGGGSGNSVIPSLIDNMRRPPGRMRGGLVSFQHGGFMAGAVDPDQFKGGWNNAGGGIGSHAGDTSGMPGPPTGMWTGPEVLPPTRMWPGPLEGPNLPQTPGYERPGPFPGWNKMSPPLPAWRMPGPPTNIAGFDRGGWLMPGRTLAHNRTGYPELVTPLPSLWRGGLLRRGVVVPPGPLPPRGPSAQELAPRPRPAPPLPTAPPPMAPVAPPPVGPGAPGEVPPPVVGPGAAPEPSTPSVGPGAPAPPIPSGEPAPGAPPLMGMPPPGTGVTSADIGTGVGPGETGMHLHPALQKGIASTASTLGALGDTALAAGTFGAAGLAGGGGGGGGGGMGGAGGLSISGMAAQAGKIITDIANVGASFLVGSVTGGTTKNPYGVTQRATNPSGGTTRSVDRSTHYHGDMVTNNLDEYFRRMDLRQAQDHQASVGTYDRYL